MTSNISVIIYSVSVGFYKEKRVEHFKRKFSIAPLKGKVFFILVLAGCLFSLMTIVINIALGLDFMTVISALATAIMCMFLFAYAFKTEDYTWPARIGFFLMIVILFPILWIHNNGVRGSIPYFIIFTGILITIICEKKIAHKFYILLGIVLLILAYIEIYHKEWIVGYATEEAYMMDLLLSFILMGSFSIIIIEKLMKEYHLRIEELQTLQAEFRKLSITDELTGIYNRRHIIREIDNKLSHEVHVMFSLIMIDIDDFKNINDQYGHGVGDEVIVGVSRQLESCVRPIDVVGRIGGEEFLIVLVDTSEHEARDRAKDMKEQIQNMSWSIPELIVTVSGGVCSKMPEDELNDLLERVDQYLYEAKRSGKNTIV